MTTRKDPEAAKKTKDINPLWGFVFRKPCDKKRTLIPLFEDGAVQWFAKKLDRCRIISDYTELYKKEPMTPKKGSKIANVTSPAFL